MDELSLPRTGRKRKRSNPVNSLFLGSLSAYSLVAFASNDLHTALGVAAFVPYSQSGTFMVGRSQQGIFASISTSTETPLTKRTLQEQTEEIVAIKSTLSLQGKADTSWNIPPWLGRYYDPELLADSIGDGTTFPSQQLQNLQASLTLNGFSVEDVEEIIQTMIFYFANPPSANDAGDPRAAATSLLLGMIDFVQLIVEEHSIFQSVEDNDQDDDNTNDATPKPQTQMHLDVFASKSVILAGIAHYAECILARQDGIYDWVKTMGMVAPAKHRGRSSTRASSSKNLKRVLPEYTIIDVPDKGEAKQHSLSEYLTSGITSPKSIQKRSDRNYYPPNFPADAKAIARSAASVKRAEILAQTFLGVGNSRRLSKDEAEGLRGLLLSNMEDWRALALRCVASLFRLNGIIEQQQLQQYQLQSGNGAAGKLDTFKPLFAGLRSPEVVHTAQEAILVYATLAQRLGMHHLKAKIEAKAFQILYQRQYRAVSSVYKQNGAAMRSIRSFLSNEIDTLLRDDEKFMKYIDCVQVSSRVKEPYSFWKKILKKKAKQREENRLFNGVAAESWSDSRTSDLSLAEVNDGIALRVILRTRKEIPGETEETTRAREKLLCYYAQHLIRKRFRPAGGKDRMKDYIQHPKPNGYQSLHYTASLTDHTGQQFPFEVQIRSEDMHRIAEYGVAAHWDYKLASAQVNAGTNSNVMSVLALGPAAEEKADFIADETVTPTKRARETTEFPLNDDTVEVSPTVTVDDESQVVAELGDNSMIENKSGRYSGQLEYIDALVNARHNLLQERVYVFVAGAGSLSMDQGQLLILDSDSSISDALKYMQENSPEIFAAPLKEDIAGNETTGDAMAETNTKVKAESSLEVTVWRNGQQTRLNETIRNGDVLLIQL